MQMDKGATIYGGSGHRWGSGGACQKDFALKNEVGEMLNCRALADREFCERFPSHLDRDGGSLVCSRKLCALAEWSDTCAPCWSWCVRTCGRGLTLGTVGWCKVNGGRSTKTGSALEAVTQMTDAIVSCGFVNGLVDEGEVLPEVRLNGIV